MVSAGWRSLMLSEHCRQMYEKNRTGEYRKYRTGSLSPKILENECANMNSNEAALWSFRRLCEFEQPVVIPGDRFFFTRTNREKTWGFPGGLDRKNNPDKWWNGIENITPEWALLLRDGCAGRIQKAKEALSKDSDPAHAEYRRVSIGILEAVCALSDRYAAAAEASGDPVGAAMLRNVPRHAPKTLHEALQSIYFLFSLLHLSGVNHLGFGRIDQYLLSFFLADRAEGRLTRADALDLFCEFFLMLNRDHDLYGAVQTGDDGESLMLGGCRPDGTPGCNELTELILEAAYEVSSINPKINLRVDRSTPESLLVRAARLTGRGLGFPQYCNDEIIIPSLCSFGYPLEDARDYTVAACWEFVVKDGRDIPNLFAVNLPLAVDRAIRKALREKESFDALLARIRPEIRALCPSSFSTPGIFPNPLFSALCGTCLERGLDLNNGGGSHYHYGCHGCGSSTAADSLAAVKKLVYDDSVVPPEIMLDALEKNYEGYDVLREQLRTLPPKVGSDDPDSDFFLTFVFDAFADVLGEMKDNGRGGRIRPGTGSALNYATMTKLDNPKRVRATADGRCDGEYLSSSLAPSPGVRAPGILSILRTYGKLDYNRLCNGGPITVELSPAFFRSEDALKKMGAIVRAFVSAGCQQLQVNVLDAAVLKDAQKHPDLHRDLIVRVWGWSGYFVELDPVYQNQIIGRQAYGA